MMLAAETKKAPRASTLRGQRIVPPPWLGYPSLGCSPDQPSVGARPNSVSPSNDSVHEEKKRSYKLRAQKVRPLPENTTEKIVNRLLTPTALSGTWHPALLGNRFAMRYPLRVER